MWITRLRLRLAPRSTLSAPVASRIEVTPPSLCHAPDSAWQRLMFWLLAPAPGDAAPPLSRLPEVRRDFLAALQDTTGPDAGALATRIELARTLREFWHLRTELYRVVGIAHSQFEAERRLAALNRHFRSRAARSGVAAP